MAIMTHAFTYTLTAVYDLREWDEDTRSYFPIDDDCKAVCAHCGRLHAKVYEVTRDQDGKVFTVGSACSRKQFAGWVPEEKEVKRLAKEAEKLAKSRAHQKTVDLAIPIADAVKAMPLPRILVLSVEQEGRYPQITWGTEGSRVKVWGLVSEGLTDERRECLYEAWMREQARILLEKLYPPTAVLNAEDTNYTRRTRVQRVVHDLLHIL